MGNRPQLHLSSDALTLVAVAQRHLRDAAYLANHQDAHPAHRDGEPVYVSLAQAYHLAGFAPECIRKALLSSRAFDKTLGHRFHPPTAPQANEDMLAVIMATDPFAARYYSPRSSWAQAYPALAAWTENARYDRDADPKFDRERVRALLDSARDAVNGVVLSLWLDGRLPEELIGS